MSAPTDRHESAQPDPWAVTDAPADYVDSMVKAIVGFDIEIAELTGKFKASQNRSYADRAGVRAALHEKHDDAELDELVRGPSLPLR